MRFLIVYGTTDGQTAQIAGRMANHLRQLGHEAMSFDAGAVPGWLDVSGFDAIFVGASMHVQGYQWRVRRFIRRHLDALNHLPSAFFSVCLSIESKDEVSRNEARAIPKRFVERMGWAPRRVEVIAGALKFSRYGFLRKPIMRAIAKKEMGEVDTSRDQVFTDWSQVQRFAEALVSAVGQARPTKAA